MKISGRIVENKWYLRGNIAIKLESEVEWFAIDTNRGETEESLRLTFYRNVLGVRQRYGQVYLVRPLCPQNLGLATAHQTETTSLTVTSQNKLENATKIIENKTNHIDSS